MQYDQSDQFITDALAVIRKYDYTLYADMTADDWAITTSVREHMAVTPNASPWDLMVMSEAYGATLSEPIRNTWLNRPEITGWATDNQVPVAYFAANVLTHEYAHIHQAMGYDPESELPAYRADEMFASRLPEMYGSKMKAESEAALTELMP